MTTIISILLLLLSKQFVSVNVNGPEQIGNGENATFTAAFATDLSISEVEFEWTITDHPSVIEIDNTFPFQSSVSRSWSEPGTKIVKVEACTSFGCTEDVHVLSAANSRLYIPIVRRSH